MSVVPVIPATGTLLNAAKSAAIVTDGCRSGPILSDPNDSMKPMLDLSPFVAAVVLHGARGPAAARQAREVLSVSPWRFAQMLNALIDTELALQLDPVTAHRLRRVREARQRSRSLRSA
jgi:hypothetical protein